MLIGVDFGVCTILHHVETLLWEDHLKRINGNAPWPVFDLGRMGQKLENLGLVRIGRIGAAAARLTSARTLVDAALRLLIEEGSDRYQ